MKIALDPYMLRGGAFHRACRGGRPIQRRRGADQLAEHHIAQAAQHVAPRGGSAFIHGHRPGGARGRGSARRLRPAARSPASKSSSRPCRCPTGLSTSFRYDPAKSEAYAATTRSSLVWATRLRSRRHGRSSRAVHSTVDGPPRPRHAASARLDLASALISAERHEEAADAALQDPLAYRGGWCHRATGAPAKSSTPFPSKACSSPANFRTRIGKPAVAVSRPRCHDAYAREGRKAGSIDQPHHGRV